MGKDIQAEVVHDLLPQEGHDVDLKILDEKEGGIVFVERACTFSKRKRNIVACKRVFVDVRGNVKSAV